MYKMTSSSCSSTWTSSSSYNPGPCYQSPYPGAKRRPSNQVVESPTFSGLSRSRGDNEDKHHEIEEATLRKNKERSNKPPNISTLKLMRTVLICQHYMLNTALQPSNMNMETKEDITFENEQPSKERFELEYRENGYLEMSMKKLERELFSIKDTSKRNSINLDLIRLGVQSHTQEMKKEIERLQEKLKQLVQEKLNMYDADRMGIPDFALEAHGGEIVSTPNTEQYNPQSVNLLFYTIPIPSHSTPENIIQPSLQLGDCWAFVGSKGKIVIKLAATMLIHAVTIDHVSHKVTLFRKIDSAPKDFTVYGMKGPQVESGLKKLGHFQFNSSGETRQTFQVANGGTLKESFSHVMLSIESNHGNENFTCVYRFRVHGQLLTAHVTEENHFH